MGEISPGILPSWSSRTSSRDAGRGARPRLLTSARQGDVGQSRVTPAPTLRPSKMLDLRHVGRVHRLRPAAAVTGAGAVEAPSGRGRPRPRPAPGWRFRAGRPRTARGGRRLGSRRVPYAGRPSGEHGFAERGCFRTGVVPRRCTAAAPSPGDSAAWRQQKARWRTGRMLPAQHPHGSTPLGQGFAWGPARPIRQGGSRSLADAASAPGTSCTSRSYSALLFWDFSRCFTASAPSVKPSRNRPGGRLERGRSVVQRLCPGGVA